MKNNKNTLFIMLSALFGVSSMAMERISLKQEKPVFSTTILSQEESDFIWFARKKNFAKVTELSVKIKNINVKNKDGSTALHWAASVGSLEIVNLLLSKGAAVNVRDNKGKTPLHYAAGNGFVNTIDLLLKSGAEVDSRDNEGGTPLHCAIFRSKNSAVEKLIAHKANLKFLCDGKGRTPLHIAAINGDCSCIAMVLERFAVPDALENKKMLNAQDYAGYTALHHAAQHGHAQAITLLIHHGVDVNIQDTIKQRTPLLVCLRNMEGTFIHADSMSELTEKAQKRLGTLTVLECIQALKSSSALDCNVCDKKGVGVRECIDMVRFDSEFEKKMFLEALLPSETNKNKNA